MPLSLRASMTPDARTVSTVPKYRATPNSQLTRCPRSRQPHARTASRHMAAHGLASTPDAALAQRTYRASHAAHVATISTPLTETRQIPDETIFIRHHHRKNQIPSSVTNTMRTQPHQSVYILLKIQHVAPVVGVLRKRETRATRTGHPQPRMARISHPMHPRRNNPPNRNRTRHNQPLTPYRPHAGRPHSETHPKAYHTRTTNPSTQHPEPTSKNPETHPHRRTIPASPVDTHARTNTSVRCPALSPDAPAPPTPSPPHHAGPDSCTVQVSPPPRSS